MRIVSLLASATEIVCELGLEDRLVGISHECDYPERILDRPRLSSPRFDPEELTSREIDRAVREAHVEHGGVYRIHRDRLREVDPDLILTQAVCDVCAVPTSGVTEVVDDLGLDAKVVSLDAHTLEGIFETVLQVGRAAGAGERAEEVVAGYRARLEDVKAAVARSPRAERRRVLGIEWLDPPYTPGHWVPEMVEAAGGENVAGTAGERSRRASWDELGGLEPDVVVVMPCGYGLDESLAEADRHRDALEAVAPEAFRTGRAWAVDASSFFNRSGPRVVTGIEILAGILHPERAGPPEAGHAKQLAASLRSTGSSSSGAVHGGGP